MNRYIRTSLFLIISLVFAASALAQTSAFTYQGNLNQDGGPANGTYDFEFALFDALEAGNQVGPTVTRTGVEVSNGSFSVSLDFEAVFPGDDRFLQIRVRASNPAANFVGIYTTLSPRSRIASVPYAVRSLSSGSATNADQLGGVTASQYVLTTDPRMTDARTPTSGSADYIQNTTTQQVSSNFNISGTGKADEFDANLQYDLSGSRVLSVSGTSNLFVGKESGTNNVGNDNTFAGWSAGLENTTGSYNSLFGANSGRNSNGRSNSFFGSSAGQMNLAGSGNSFFGREAGFNNSDGSRNTFYGRNAGKSNTIGSSNSAFGYAADLASPELTFATAIGANTVVSSSNTVQIGRTDGSDTVFVPGNLNVTGSWGGVVDVTQQYNIDGNRVFSIAGTDNLFAGVGAGVSNTLGQLNSFFGKNAGLNNTEGSRNSFFGNGAGLSNTTGWGNSFYGDLAGNKNTIGQENSFFGQAAGFNNTSGNNNAFFGKEAGFTNTNGNANSFFGRNAGKNNLTGTSNTFVGYLAGDTNTNGNYNTIVGRGADVGGDGLTYATAVGAEAVVSTSNTVQLGRTDGSDAVIVPGVLNVLTHYSAGGNRILSNPGVDNLFVGILAGNSNSSGERNSIFGNRAGRSNTVGSDNSFYGWNSGRDNTEGYKNSFFGMRAGYLNTIGAENQFFGYYAGARNTEGVTNSFFGSYTGEQNTTGSGNAFFGSGAGRNNTTGIGNTFSGRDSGVNNSSSYYNSFFGAFSGMGSCSGGWELTAVGYKADVGQCNLSNATALGAGAVVTASNTVQLGRNGSDTVRIGKTGSAGSTSLCLNTSNEIATCSSSIRYKSDIESFQPGLKLIKKLRPVSFSWKNSGEPDIGLIAEEVAEIEPLLVNYRNGEVEGVKLDRLGVVLINVVKEQQKTIEKQQEQIEALTALVCGSNKTAKICKK